jgi:hypothetical protein
VNRIGTIRRAGSFVRWGMRFVGRRIRFVVCRGEREYGDIMACTVRDTSC